MKKVLIISPNFPPINSADMHRVRHMSQHIKRFGWEAEVVVIDPDYMDSCSREDLLLKTIPNEIIIHQVKAWSKKYTSKVGLSSLSMRSFFFYRKKVNNLIKSKKYDLIFFSTTAFHVLALGPYWKKKYGIPFVIDFQDPWRSDFYLDKPKSERPPKFWFHYYIDRFLEKKTVLMADALISVSKTYLDTFQDRYTKLTGLTKVIPFSIDPIDFEIVRTNKIEISIKFDVTKINIVYIGRGGYDLAFANRLFFQSLVLMEKDQPELFSKIKCYFIGTSYAPVGLGVETIKPIADELGLGDKIIEITDRIPYFSALYCLQKADLLFIPGSTDEGYTASKIYPYVLAEKPIVSVFHEKSSVVGILNDCTNASVITFGNVKKNTTQITDQIFHGLLNQIKKINSPQLFDKTTFEPYMAESMTKKVVEVFEKVCSEK